MFLVRSVRGRSHAITQTATTTRPRAHHSSIVSNPNRHRGFATDAALSWSCFAGVVLTFPPIKRGGKRDCWVCDWRVLFRDLLTWGFVFGVIQRGLIVRVLGVFWA